MVSSNPAVPSGPDAQVGKYRLLRRIASGGMAEVYLATDDGKSLWAVKLMLPHLADHSEFLGLFLDEARLASQINHPNVARVRDMGMENGRLFLAMEYARGQPLSSLIQKLKEKGAALTPAQAAAILAQSAAGLNAAHDAKARDGTPMELVHRDVSPQNLLLTEDGVVKVVDFGIAKARNKLVVTQVNTTRGKPWYMSPEQMRGEKLDRRADVFSLGAVLFELLLGSRLFEGDVDQVMYKALNEPLPDILKLKPDVPKPLAEMIKRACARKPDDRFASAWDLEQELRAFEKSQGGAGDLGALVRDNFPRMPATVDEVMGVVSSRFSARTGPGAGAGRVVARPNSNPAAARTTTTPPTRVRRPGSAAPTVGEAPPVEDTPIEAPDATAPMDKPKLDPPVSPSAAPPSPTGEITAVGPPEAQTEPPAPPKPAPAKPAEPADDAQKVRVDIPKRGQGADDGAAKKKLIAMVGGIALVFLAVGGGLTYHFATASKPPPPEPPKPPPPSLLAPVTAPAGAPAGQPAQPTAAAKPPEPEPVQAAPPDLRPKLRVTCTDDNCQVQVDNDYHSAPFEMALAPGKHEVSVRYGKSKTARTHTVNMKQGTVVLHFGDGGESKNFNAAGEMMDARGCGSASCRIAHLNHALARDASNAAAQKMLGEEYLKEGKYERAIFHLQNYLDLAKNPSDFEEVWAKMSAAKKKL